VSVKLEKIKKIFILLLAAAVALLVIYAIYSNKSRFYSTDTVKYSRITIDEATDIDDIISKYSGSENKDKFINAIKKVNNIAKLDNESVYGKTIFIPLVEN
jgi:cell division protein FtsL